MYFFGLDISTKGIRRIKAAPATPPGNVTTDEDGVKTKNINTPDGKVMPVSGGRSSVPEGDTSILDLLLGEVSLITPEFQIELIKIIQHLCIYNPDVSFALDNIVQLANTPYDISFNDGLPDTQVTEMKAELNRVQNNWYAYSGGIQCLRNDILAQIAISGALSSEMVPEDNLTGIKKVVLVTPANIRFAYDPKQDMHMPFQQLTKLGRKISNPSLNIQGLTPLNTNTYKYYALRRFSNVVMRMVIRLPCKVTY